MKLVYGTTNKSKIHFMKRHVEHLGIEILSLNDVNASVPDVDESGNNPLENAKIKALAYHSALNIPVFSCDSGLYIDSLDDIRQPGVHVRNIEGRRLNDDEMITYYSALATEFGGRVTARYQNAICLVMNESEIYEHMDADIASEPFYIVTKPHEKRREGFPLDSLSVHIESGLYYYEIGENREKYSDSDDGFAAFFQRVLTKKGRKQATIRIMTIDDYEQVYSLWISTPNMGLNNIDDSKVGIAKYLDRNPNTCFVAESDSHIVGVILSGHDGRRGYIHHTAVDESEQRHGIGTSLVNTAMSALKREGINKVALVVFEKNEKGNAFWEKHGFITRNDLNYRNKAISELTRIDT